MPLRTYIAFAATLVALVVADQATKYAAVAQLTRALDGRPTLGERLGDFYRLKHLDGEGAAAQPDLRKPSVVVVPGFWSHRYVENPGAAWGMLARIPDSVRVPFFFAASAVAIGFIGVFLRRVGGQRRLLSAALVLVLAGAVGNFIDRVARGYVIDFIDWHWRNHPDLHWPTFNVADAAITAGVLLMLVDSLRPRRPTAELADRVSLPRREAEPG